MNPIDEIVKQRGIQYLVHFTRLDNIKSILAYGLVPHDQLHSKGITTNFNDSDRIDGCENANCLSITFPNYKMFWACRQTFKDVKWIVLAINPCILWEKDCAFCVENAASNTVTSIPLEERRGVAAFERLYEEFDGKPPRKDLGISDRAPTNPQAEVLVFGVIEPKYVLGVIVNNRAAETDVKNMCPGVSLQVIPGFFSARKDFKHWK